MKKIIILLVVAFFFTGLFGQDKIVIDEKAALELEKLTTALKSAGLETELGSFIPESEESRVDDALSVDEFIESLESTGSRSTYISAYRLIPIYQFYPTGGGWILAWNGDVSSSPTIVGDDWSGVKHTRESAGGSIAQTVYVAKSAYAYLWDNVPISTPRLCAQLFINVRVYVPGFGYIIIPQPFGDKECLNVNFNW